MEAFYILKKHKIQQNMFSIYNTHKRIKCLKIFFSSKTTITTRKIGYSLKNLEWVVKIHK